MSAPPKFATLPDAIAAYREGRSRRWAEVDGHQVDLHAAAHPCAVSRPEWSSAPLLGFFDLFELDDPRDRAMHDRAVAQNIAAELSQAVEVLPELAVPSEPPPDASADRCPWCSRPWDGAR